MPKFEVYMSPTNVYSWLNHHLIQDVENNVLSEDQAQAISKYLTKEIEALSEVYEPKNKRERLTEDSNYGLVKVEEEGDE